MTPLSLLAGRKVDSSQWLCISSEMTAVLNLNDILHLSFLYAYYHVMLMCDILVFCLCFRLIVSVLENANVFLYLANNRYPNTTDRPN